jgi:hypothetical protein
MAGHLRVPGGVPVRGAVTAVRAAAFLAGAQVDPLRADLHALIAMVVARRLHRRERREVNAVPIDHRRTLLRQRIVVRVQATKLSSHVRTSEAK